MLINKYSYQKTNEKKILRKHKKQWVVVSLTTLGLFAGAHMVTANADTSVQTQTQNENVATQSDTNKQPTISVTPSSNASETSTNTSTTSSNTSTTSSNDSTASSNASTTSSNASTTSSNASTTSSNTSTTSSNASTASSNASSTSSNTSTTSSNTSATSSNTSTTSSNTSATSSNASTTSSNTSTTSSNDSSTGSNTSTTNSKDSTTSSNTSATSSATSSQNVVTGSNSVSASNSSNGSQSTTSSTNASTSSANTNTSTELTATKLDTLMTSNTNLKTQLVNQFNLQAVSSDDLGTELLNRIGTDSTQQGILLSLVNTNPVPANGLYPKTTTSNGTTQITLTFAALPNDAHASVSSSYPQYIQIGQNTGYYIAVNDDHGNSPMSSVTGLSVETSSNGNVTTSQIPISNNVPANNVSYNLNMTKNDIYNQGIPVPISTDDPYWNATALANGTRTYTVFRVNGQPTDASKYLGANDYIKYTIDFTPNSQHQNATANGYSQTSYYYGSYITPTNQVNYTDMNGHSISSSQYLDSAGANLNGSAFSATVPSSNGYITYQVTSSINAGTGQASINSDGSVSISGTDNIVHPTSDSNPQTNAYNITYIKPTIKTNTKTITRTVNYVDTNGNQLASSNNQAITLTQNAVYDALTNGLLGYVPTGETLFSNLSNLSSSDSGTWNYTNGTQFNSVSVQDLSGQGYQPIDIASVNSETVTSNTGNETYNITYNKTPTAPNPINVTFTRNITLVDANTNQTINYSQNNYNNGVWTDQSTQSYPPKPLYTTPNPSNDNNVTKVTQYLAGYQTPENVAVTIPSTTAPDLSSLGYTTANPNTIDGSGAEFTDSGSKTQNVTIKYAHATTTVNSSNAKSTNDVIAGTNTHYPSGVTQSDLQSTVTRDIYYNDVNNPTKTVASPVHQSATLNRDAIVDNVTGQLLGYSQPNQNQIQSDGNNAWVSNVPQLDAVTSPDLTQSGYKSSTLDSVPALNLSNQPTSGLSTSVTVSYSHNQTTVNHTQPANAGDTIPGTNQKYPSGVSQNDLNRQITRTIQYQDATNGQTIAPTVIQTVNYYRNALVDEVTGQLLYLDNDNHPIPDQNSWLSDNNQFQTVTSPNMTSHGYQAPDIDNVMSTTVGQNDSNQVVTVKYQHDTVNVWANQPKNTTDKIDNSDAYYPNGVDNNSLNQTITRTVQYQDATNGQMIAPTVTQTANFHRNAKIDKVTGAFLGYTDDNGNVINDNQSWLTNNNHFDSITSPDLSKRGYLPANSGQMDAITVNANDSNISNIVSYQHRMQTVMANQPKTTSDDVNDNGTAYPQGVTQSDLNHQVSRTIQYVDSTNDKNIAPTVTQTVAFYRNARVDAVTGQLVGYTDDQDNLLASGGWLSHNNQFSAVNSPDLKSRGYKDPNIAIETQITVQPTDNDIQQTVNYDHDTIVVNANQPKTNTDGVEGSDVNYPSGVDTDSLNHDVTRTMKYLNVRNQTIHDNTVQTVHFSRNALVDKVTGALIGYVNHNGQVVSDGHAAWYSDHPQFDNFTLPDLTSTGYETPSKSVINSQLVNVDTESQNMTSIYQDHLITIPNTQPKTNQDTIAGTNIKYPAGVSQNDLNRTHTRTIQYEDLNGNQVADPTVQTATFSRNAVVNVATGEVVKYTDWQSYNNSFNGVSVPYPDGYNLVGNTTLNGYMNGMTMGVNDNNVVQTVQYSKVVSTATPVNPTPQPTKPQPEPIPSTIRYQIISGQTLDGSPLPAGLTVNDLHRVVTRTIQYIDDNGNHLRKTKVQTVNYYRTAIVDLTHNKLVGYTNGENGDPMANPNDAWYSPKEHFDAVESVNLREFGYQKPSQKTVGRQHVNFDSPDTEVTVTYHRVKYPKQPAKPTPKPTHHQTTQPTKPTQPIQPQAKSTHPQKPQFVGKQANKLPQTGEASDEWLTLIGLIAVITSGLYLGFSFKNRFKQD